MDQDQPPTISLTLTTVIDQAIELGVEYTPLIALARALEADNRRLRKVLLDLLVDVAANGAPSAVMLAERLGPALRQEV